MMTVSMTVNGEAVSHEVADETLLVEYLRETLRLTGTHVGCDTTQCGCCTIHLDGISVKSCTVLAAQAEGREVTTIEGLAKDGALHPVRLLHAGPDHGRCRVDPHLGGSARRASGAPGDGRQSLSLHGLSQHRQGDPESP
jgi:aerobic-type carbon monoxide dehydrogenase small subunit (CoxS/CutS family)